MRILFRKLTDERHTLAVVHADGRREEVECESRSYLEHDLLHYAAEAEAGYARGFWGQLAAGRALAELNDRTRPPDAELMQIEPLVGALYPLTLGRSPEALAELLARNPVDPILTPAFIAGVAERFRQLLGQWRATRRNAVMELPWPPA